MKKEAIEVVQSGLVPWEPVSSGRRLASPVSGP